jgi:hypothetical protein
VSASVRAGCLDRRPGNSGQHGLQQVGDAVAVACRNRLGLAKAQLEEVGAHEFGIQVLGLVDHQPHAPAELAQCAGDGVVVGSHAGAAVDHQDHGVGLLGRRQRLRADLARQLRVFAQQAAGVDDPERPLAEPAFAEQPVARDAGKIRHQRVATAREAVEQRRLADVRPAKECDDRCHVARQSPGRSAYRRPPSDKKYATPSRTVGASRKASLVGRVRPASVPSSPRSQCT